MNGSSVARVGQPGFGATERRDRWWINPLLGAVGLGVFIVYSTWAVFVGNHYAWGPYLSPFYSPLLASSLFPISASVLVAWVPLGFRLSCYYYRKAYYRSYFMSPPACAVSEPRRNYTGEARFPLRYLPVIHRWFLYLSILVLIWLWIDAAKAFYYHGAFYLGAGSLIMLVNVILLSCFTLGCHALRSLVGGNSRCFSCERYGNMRHGMWSTVSRFTERHQLWAWLSLYMVALTDLYIRLCSWGVVVDPRLIGR